MIGKKSLEDSIKDGLVITATSTGIFGGLNKAANVNPSKASLDAMAVMKFASRIFIYSFQEMDWQVNNIVRGLAGV